MEANGNDSKVTEVSYLTEEDVKLIVKNSGGMDEEEFIEKYVVQQASNKMLGFLADYWKLSVTIANSSERKFLNFFIKAVSRTNAAKANMVTEMKLFEKELIFFSDIRTRLELPGLKPWSAKFITPLNDAMVFQDLNALQYKMRNKFERFDIAHMLQALSTLARFHASAFIFEENRSKELSRPYRINDEYGQYLHAGGYSITDPWFDQCLKGALGAVRTFSKYSHNKEAMALIESRWSLIWSTAVELGNVSSKHRSVVCHRDLWNNNLMFHYNKVGEPDDCILVDFQSVNCQPPAGDIMFLLYCNLDRKFRERNTEKFLNYYHQELGSILCRNGYDIEDILPKEQFLLQAEEMRLWGLMACACIMPIFWLDDDLTTKHFCDTLQFNNIFMKERASFIKKIMEVHQDYREAVMTIFEELVERYCL